jgi:hypothetical protein
MSGKRRNSRELVFQIRRFRWRQEIATNTFQTLRFSLLRRPSRKLRKVRRSGIGKPNFCWDLFFGSQPLASWGMGFLKIGRTKAG